MFASNKYTAYAVSVMLVIALSPFTFSAGFIRGQVQTAGKTKKLEGAKVTIDPLKKSTITNAAGEFVFPDIKSGIYTLRVDYLGFKPQTKSITVGDTDRHDIFSLETLNKVNEEVLVYGQAAAMNASINRQRHADGIVAIIDTKSMGDFPDQNISESLQRLPGVSIERDQGEGRYVAVRGLNPDYNSVTVNGINIPSPDAGRRAVALDVIPNDLVGSVQVTKTVTPDKDADSLGGAIEITSLSAFDREDVGYKVYADASYNGLMKKTSPKLGVTLTNTFDLLGKEDVLGVAFSASYYNRDFGSGNVETGGKWSFDDGKLEGLEEIEQRDYTINRERLGLGLNLDLKAFDDTDLYFRSLYSSFKDKETRFSNNVEFSAPLMAGVVTDDAEVVRELKNRKEVQTIQSYTVGGQTHMNSWTMDYSVGLSEARENKGNYIDGAGFKAEFESQNGVEGVGVGFTGGKSPAIFANRAYHDMSQYKLDEVVMGEADAKDRQGVVKLDVMKAFFMADYPSSIKWGAKYNQRKKVSQENVIQYADFDHLGEKNTLVSFMTKRVDYGIGSFGSGISNARVLEAIAGLEGKVDAEKSTVNDYIIRENIVAAYGMMTTDIQDVRVIAGLRYEQTHTASEGKRYDDASDAVSATHFDTKKKHFLPAILVKYDINDQMLLRGGWTNTLARPTFEQISPGALIENKKGKLEGEAGNPYLDTMTATNIDLGYEFYPGDVSVLSAGVFYKKIDDFIYANTVSGKRLGVDLNYKVQSWSNGDSASLLGLELNYVHQFDSGILLGANATFIDSTAELSFAEGSRDISLPGQSDFVGNILLGYEKDRYSLRLSGNYKSKALIKIQNLDKRTGDIYEDAGMHWDFVAKANILENLSASFKVVNLTDESYYAYQHKPSYNYQYEKYGRTFQLGLEITNF